MQGEQLDLDRDCMDHVWVARLHLKTPQDEHSSHGHSWAYLQLDACIKITFKQAH